MDAQRLLHIATELSGHYLARRSAQIDLGNQVKDYTARLLAITPAEGWPGKNDDARKLAARQAEASDETLRAIGKRQREIENDLSNIEVAIEQLGAERRAIEWVIRDRMAAALGSGRGDPVDSGIADDTDGLADLGADRELSEQFPATVYDDEGDIPF
jgi:hypothetical protein